MGRRGDDVDAESRHVQESSGSLKPFEAGIAHSAAAQHHIRRGHAAVGTAFRSTTLFFAQTVKAQPDASIAAKHLGVTVRLRLEQETIHFSFGGAKTSIILGGQRHDVHRAEDFIILGGDHHVGDFFTCSFGFLSALVDVFHQSPYFARRFRAFYCCCFDLLICFHGYSPL